MTKSIEIDHEYTEQQQRTLGGRILAKAEQSALDYANATYDRKKDPDNWRGCKQAYFSGLLQFHVKDLANALERAGWCQHCECFLAGHTCCPEVTS